MIVGRYDYKDYHAVQSTNGYVSHIRVYKQGDIHHNLLYHKQIMGDVADYCEFTETVHKFVDNHEKIQALRRKIGRIKNG